MEAAEVTSQSLSVPAVLTLTLVLALTLGHGVFSLSFPSALLLQSADSGFDEGIAVPLQFSLLNGTAMTFELSFTVTIVGPIRFRVCVRV